MLLPNRILCVLALASLVVVPAISPAWIVEIDSYPGESQNDEATTVEFDSRGDVVVGGHYDWDDWLVVKFGGGSGTELWRTVISESISGTEVVDAMALDAANDVIVAGRMVGDSYSDTDFGVVKLSGATGAEVWRAILDGTEVEARDYPFAVTTDAAGDVIAVGRLQNDTTDWDGTVVKLSGTDGSQLWLRNFTGTEPDGWDLVSDVATDAFGDVIIAGRVVNATDNTDIMVAKLSGSDGTTIWRTEVTRAAYEYASALAVDENGDAFVTGRIDDGESGDFAVFRFSGVDGAVVWEQDHCCNNDSGRGETIAIAPSGAVVVGGWAERQDWLAAFNVAQFDPVTGHHDWRVVIPGSQGYGAANDLAVAPDGTVWAVGRMETNSEGNTDAYVAKIRPCQIDEDDEECEDPAPSFKARVQWQKRFNGQAGNEDDFDEFYAVAVNGEGQAAVAGTVYNRNPMYRDENHSDLLVAVRAQDGSNLSGADPFRPACSDAFDNDGDGLVDFPDDPGCSSAEDLFEVETTENSSMCSGDQILVKDRRGRARNRAVSVTSRDEQLFAPVGGSIGDPRINGAVVELRNPTTGESAFANLVPSGWKAAGDPVTASQGYKYRGRGSAYGPCRNVKLGPGRLRIRCKGVGWSYTLDEPAQGVLAARLHLASGDRICTEFGGEIRDDGSTNLSERTVKFRASDAPAPAACN